MLCHVCTHVHTHTHTAWGRWRSENRQGLRGGGGGLVDARPNVQDLQTARSTISINHFLIGKDERGEENLTSGDKNTAKT